MQYPVDYQAIEFLFGGMSVVCSLGHGTRVGDDDVAQVGGRGRRRHESIAAFTRGEGEYVGGPVLSTILEIQLPDVLIISDEQTHRRGVARRFLGDGAHNQFIQMLAICFCVEFGICLNA